MSEQHPITPPPELVKQWLAEWDKASLPDLHFHQWLAVQAARWGADMELEVCVGWLLSDYNYSEAASPLRAARRPKPPSFKEQALLALSHLEKGAEPQMDTTEATYTIRRALEALPDD